MGMDGSRTKLKKADIKKVDFVPAGAQQHSRISLFKSADGEGEPGAMTKILSAITKAMSGFKVVPIDETDEDRQKCVKDATLCEAWDYTHTFHEVFESIINGDSVCKSELIQGALDQFGASVISAIPDWVNEDEDKVAKIGKKISTQRMDALKSCMKTLADLIADAESEPALMHDEGNGMVAQPADKQAGTPAEGGQIDNPGGKAIEPQNKKPVKADNDEGSGKKMAEINKSALPQDVQDYIANLETAVAKAATPAPATPAAGEDIFKGLPEGIVKMLKDQAEALKASNEQIAKMRDADDTKTFVAKAAELTSNLGVKADEFGPVLKSINAANPELATKVEAVLKAANEAVAKGDLFKESGAEGNGIQTGVAKSDAWAQIETLANTMVTKGDSKTQAEAIDAVLKGADGKRLYAIYTGKIRG